MKMVFRTTMKTAALHPAFGISRRLPDWTCYIFTHSCNRVWFHRIGSRTVVDDVSKRTPTSELALTDDNSGAASGMTSTMLRYRQGRQMAQSWNRYTQVRRHVYCYMRQSALEFIRHDLLFNPNENHLFAAQRRFTSCVYVHTVPRHIHYFRS